MRQERCFIDSELHELCPKDTFMDKQRFQWNKYYNKPGITVESAGFIQTYSVVRSDTTACRISKEYEMFSGHYFKVIC